jgi:hypothetical protein
MTARPRLTALGAGAALVLAAVAGTGPALAHGQSELAQVRAATARYHDLDAASAAGYLPGSDCVPQMGYHYVRDINTDASLLDPLAPEILVYAPTPSGELRLVAVEYASWDSSAMLFGHGFQAPNPAGGPPFHTLHAWIWQGNPNGVFAAQNPNVTCP